MKCMSRLAAAVCAALVVIGAGGCSTPEHRMASAASRDDARRTEFERCRAEGRTDCDAILNTPVNSNTTTSGDAVRERERRTAYDRCVNEGGHDCDDLLRH